MIKFNLRFIFILALAAGLFSFQSNNVAAGDHCYTDGVPGDGSNTATWQPFFPEAGNYRVFVWWAAGIAGTTTDAPFTISHDGGNQTIWVDQNTSGSTWHLLGAFTFAIGTSGSVQLSNDANGLVIADAVKFVSVDVTGPTIIIDNTNAGFSTVGDWTCEEGVPGAYESYPPETEEILAFFDDSSEHGLLWGIGPGSSAPNKLNALRRMIETAGDLIDAGDIEGACGQLMAAFLKCDGEDMPPDFAGGDAAGFIAGMIDDLMTNLECDSFGF